jgi:cytoplasmic iron level regulating protein YaaA (DUF328/UPF0246 family)
MTSQEHQQREALPNHALQRIAARLRICSKLNGLVWAARAEGSR